MNDYYHYMYMIRNTIDGKIYIGIRSCKCLPEKDTFYMGSGARLKDIDNNLLHKTIISEFPSRENALIAEMLIVNENFCLRDDTYNVTTGGENGFLVDKSKQMQGIARAKARGVYKGGKRMIDENRILAMKSEGHKVSHIAKSLSISRMSVYRALQRNTTEMG